MKSFELIKSESELLVRYIPSFNNDLISAKLGIEFNENGELVKYREDELPHRLKHLRPSSSHGLTARIKHVFIFSQADLVDEETTEDVCTFRLGKRDADWYRNARRRVDTNRGVRGLIARIPEYNSSQALRGEDDRILPPRLSRIQEGLQFRLLQIV